MSPKQKPVSESQAIAAVEDVLEALPDDLARGRVLDWAAAKYGAAMKHGSIEAPGASTRTSTQQRQINDSEIEGLGPRARAWLKKHSLSQHALDAAFHIDGDHGTLILKRVKGTSKRERVRNVAALLGAMTLVRTDQARYTAEELRDALKQYNAYDMSNNPNYVKAHADVVQGSGTSGYTTTSIGLDLAATLLQSGEL